LHGYVIQQQSYHIIIARRQVALKLLVMTHLTYKLSPL